MTNLYNKIQKLRKQGKTYNQIQKKLKCSKSLISYYLNPEGKDKLRRRTGYNRRKVKTRLKEQYGGKCSICGYNKCLDVLAFHHIDPTTKEFTFGQLNKYGVKRTEKELKKCILLCANCHGEVHAGVVTLNITKMVDREGLEPSTF